ncbi:catalase family protein [Nocardioides sp.]|uniref:catalase family protein n=1 Tax=Nocardioides sp. TaxID=35761 RepID=UPI002D7EBF10|nr:catalase family protein [Nocardioides sp.]HET8962112.1 catalase family protein [Nocardioides sp.]
MTPGFVPYTPDLEVAEPRFDEHLKVVIDKAEDYVARSATTDGSGGSVRDAHARGYGLVRAELEILDGLPDGYAQGIYATPGRHGALIRFSNGSPHAGADVRLGTSVGMALKIFGITGPTLLEDEPDTHTFDYTTINGPVFFCNTLEHYLFFQELFLQASTYFAQGRPGTHRFLSDFVTGKGTFEQDDWAWDELLAMLRLQQTPSVNALLSSYWTMGAVRHGDCIAKVRIAPDSHCAEAVVRREIEPGLASELTRPALVAELKERPYAFDLQVQLCTDLDRMPVEDLTVEWPESLSPYVTVARLRIPQQDISGPENLDKMDALSFTPWRVTAEHAPLGSLMKARKDVYRHSSLLRHALNHQKRVEPISADVVLPLTHHHNW